MLSTGETKRAREAGTMGPPRRRKSVAETPGNGPSQRWTTFVHRPRGVGPRLMSESETSVS